MASHSWNDLVAYIAHDGVAVITLCNPPVNALTLPLAARLSAAMARAGSDSTVTAIVVIGSGRTFIAGADILQLQDLAWGPPLQQPLFRDLLLQIEDSPKPVVMAMHGTALGGGLEVAMSGHYRVAARTAQLGQPEVNLGIIPGAEGTQRLPRLVGVEKAIEMCLTGKPLMAVEALQCGLVDLIAEGDLLESALSFARQGLSVRKTRERNECLGMPEVNNPIFAAGRVLAEKIRRAQVAPLRALEAIEAATILPFAEGCRREFLLFRDCLTSNQAKAMIDAFRADRMAAKTPGVDKNTRVVPIKQVAVIGAGTMGAGITMAWLNAGHPVLLREASEQALTAGLLNIRKTYEASVKRGRFTPQEVDERMKLLHPQLDWHSFDSVDLIQEAVYENLALKKQIFRELDSIAKPDCILATNTSTLSIDDMAAATSRPQFFIGLHFFSPANVMRLLEIVRGRQTSSEVIATSLAVAKELQKVSVVVANCPGFVGNRLFFPYMEEAQFLVEAGASPEQVDRALTDFGMAMGIFAVDDLSGLDVAWRVRQEVGDFRKASSHRPVIHDRLYALGRYGQKTGKGWYRYSENRQPVSDPEVVVLLEAIRNEKGVPPRSFTDEEIVQRLLYVLVNEGARVLEEGCAQRASDIDVIYRNGYGFPVWRGGPMFYADLVGLPNVLITIKQFQEQHGPRWTPAPLLERLVAERMSFRAFDQERSRLG